MADPAPPPAPGIGPHTPRAEAERVDRQAREAAALRENLRKRRQQNQQRAAAPASTKQAD